MEWTRERTLEFIEEYRKTTILWNTLSDDYKDSGAKLDAHRQLAEKFEVDVELIKKKIKNLRTAFRREYKKLHRQNPGSHKKIRSYWYGYEPLSFLEHVVIEKLGYSSGVFADLDLTDGEQSADYDDELENPLNSSEALSNPVPKHKRKFENTNDNQIDEHFSFFDNSRGQIVYEEPTYEIRPNEGNSNARYKRKKDNTEEGKNLERCLNRDEHSVYGEHVSNEIRKLDQRSQIVTKHLINNILFQAAMGKYRKTDLNDQIESISVPTNSTFQFMNPDEEVLEDHSD